MIQLKWVHFRLTKILKYYYRKSLVVSGVNGRILNMINAKEAKERSEAFYFHYIDDLIKIAADNGEMQTKAFISEDTFNRVKDSYRDLGFTISYVPHTWTMHISWLNIVS